MEEKSAKLEKIESQPMIRFSKKKRFFVKNVLLSAIILLIAACSDSPSTGNSNTISAEALETAIANRDWVLDQYEANDRIVTPFTNEEDLEFTVRFSSIAEPDGSIRRYAIGTNVCNAYGGDYMLQENILTLENVTEDTESCERANESSAALFARVLFAADGAPMLAVDGSQLVISSGSNQRLIFIDDDAVSLLSPVESIVETTWTVQSIQDTNGMTQVIPANAEWGVAFHIDGADSQELMAVKLGSCNSFNLEYTVSDGTLTKLGNFMFPEHGCTAIAPIQLPDLELMVYRIFSESAAFGIFKKSDDELTISTDSNGLLELVR